MGLFDVFNKRRLEKIKKIKSQQPKTEEDFLERALIISKEADMQDMRRFVYSAHLGKFQLKCYQGLLNEHLHEGRAYRLQVELKPDEIKRVKDKEMSMSLQMDEDDPRIKYLVKGKIVTEPIRQKGKDHAIAVIDCGIHVHTRVGVTYKKGEWVQSIGSVYLSSRDLVKVGENTVLVKEIETGIKTESGLHLLAVDSHKNLYMTSDVHGNNEYLMFKIDFTGQAYTDIDDDMTIPKGSYLSNEDLRKVPKDILDSFGKFDSFAYDEEYVFICDGTSVIRVVKHSGKLDAIRTTNDLYLKDYIAEKFGVLKENVK